MIYSSGLHRSTVQFSSRQWAIVAVLMDLSDGVGIAAFAGRLNGIRREEVLPGPLGRSEEGRRIGRVEECRIAVRRRGSGLHFEQVRRHQGRQQMCNEVQLVTMRQDLHSKPISREL